MLRWREIDPYVAVHAFTVPGVLDHDRLARAIDAQLAAWGLTQVTLDAEKRQYQYGAAAASVALPVLAADGDPDAVLAAEMQRQVNLPFPRDGTFAPFRFFVVTAADAFRVGVAYDHVFAGGDSIVALLKAVVIRYTGAGPEEAIAPELYPPTYARLLRGKLGDFARGLTSFPAMIARIRRCVRPRYVYGDGRRSAFVQLRLTTTETSAIRGAAKAWSVTVNDLMLALLLRALGPEVAGRETARRRNEIAIASIINIRDGIAAGPSRVFGQFLSSFLVSHRVPPAMPLAVLAQEVNAQTRRVKRRRMHLQTLCAIAIGGFTWRSMTPERRNLMYARNYPVWAGMTTLNVDPIWEAEPGIARVTDYVRGVSTGPFAPMVLASTTKDGRMTIGITYRLAAFNPDDLARVQAALLDSIRVLQ